MSMKELMNIFEANYKQSVTFDNFLGMALTVNDVGDATYTLTVGPDHLTAPDSAGRAIRRSRASPRGASQKIASVAISPSAKAAHVAKKRFIGYGYSMRAWRTIRLSLSFRTAQPQ